ncbi:MAG: sodium/solute symporter [Phycisphaeraceae bacterium]|jgi:SSS family solute:Na+ symporter|nr:sodium/solute symporter [Phycisphaeraceae bacterium]
MTVSETDIPAEGLATLDWLIIAAYVVGMIALGWYFSRRQRSTEEYFVGSGNMNPTLIGISIFATLLSTISYLAYPGELIAKGPVLLASSLALPLVFLIVAFLLLPVYMRQRTTSAYELLEAKLGIGIRLLGSVMFIALRLVWMSLLIYLAAKAMTVMIGVDKTWIWLVVLCTGFVAVIYTSLGGLRAVVITDLFQTILLFGGALLVIITVTIQTGGFDWFPTQWHDNWDRQPVFSFDPSTRITVVGIILSTLIWYVCTAGSDQTTVQRFMATRNVKAARRSYAINLIVGFTVAITLALVGFALLGFFKARPEELPQGMDVINNADFLFPHYIAYHLPMGISGLVVAAMFAAAMSSIDSGVNSITAVVTTDFLDRFGIRPKTEKGHVRVAQLLAFVIGAIVVVGSSFMEHIPGNITAVTQKTTNLLVTPLFGLFFFALFVPFAKPLGVLAGTICGTATAVLIAFSGPIFGTNPDGLDPISFMWISPAALVVNVFTGSVISLVLARWARRT